MTDEHFRSQSRPGTPDEAVSSAGDVERQALLAALNAQRAHVLSILDGLDDEALRRPVLPSGWSCLGLVHHLAADVEQFWFRAVVDGEQQIIDQLAQSPDNAWDVPTDLPSQAVFDLYRRRIDAANDVIARTAVDAAPMWWPEELFGTWRMNSLRKVMLHVITETACHAGQLDAVRELIDGRQWLILTP